MAAYIDNRANTEMGSETNVHSVELSEFVKTCDLPQCVCVTDGNFLSRNVQISSGDVLLLKSCDRGQVTLSYRDEISHLWTEVSVNLDYPQKFNVLPPKDTNTENRTVSMVTYPTISDLMLDCPTYFEATASYEDPYLPNMSVNIGDRFWFVGLVSNPKDGVERLKVRDEKDNLLFLSLQCRGNFCPLKDDKEYTVKELLELAPVQRRLKMVVEEPNSEGNSDTTEKTMEIEHSADAYTAVSKASDRSQTSISCSSLSASNVDANFVKPVLLPKSFSGIIHLHKHESSLAVSPYNDLETTWYIPVTANLKVRTYSQNDYEIPAPRKQMLQTRVPLPLKDERPRLPAPNTPPLQQPLVPINISNFVDIYGSTFPVKAKILDTSESHPFFQEILKDVDEVIVYRMEEARRLYVKDTKSDTVYSLSHDLRLSFIEYPEKFKTVSELLHLPVGTDVTVLEDIAADFPKPFSLRFGDIIRLTSNTPYFIKMKHINRDCHVIKCERIDPDGGDNKKLKLPIDFEMSMVKTTDSNSKRMISLQDLLTEVVPIPNQSVASVPAVSEDIVLKELPVDLRILRSMKETFIVASSKSLKFPSMLSPKAYSSSNSGISPKRKTAAMCSRQESVSLTNIGLPLTSGIILAFRDRLDLFQLDVVESEADYIRLPLEKMTMAQFEERERLRKLNSDYEDIEFGSSSTLDECGAGTSTITRTSSTGVIDSKQKSKKMDKVLRLSRALNPKHWRHSKAEPEPLPHPSAIGIMALAARPRDEISNDYHHSHVDSASARKESLTCESTATGASTASSEEDENFYEDVEIGPLKSSTIGTTTSRQTGAFSGPTHRSLPPRTLPNQLTRCSDSRTRGAYDDTAYAVTASDTAASGGIDRHAYDVPKAFAKTKNLSTNRGNNLGDRLSMKPKYDVPKSNKVKGYPKEDETVRKTTSNAAPVDIRPPDIKPPLPPPKPGNKALDLEEKKDNGSTPIPPTRRKGRKSTSQTSDLPKSHTSQAEQESPQQQRILKSISLIDSVQSTNESSLFPKPKPRGLKKPTSLQETQPSLQSPLPKSRSTNTVRDADSSSLKARPSTVISEVSPSIAAENLRPKPPPKPKAATHTTV